MPRNRCRFRPNHPACLFLSAKTPLLPRQWAGCPALRRKAGNEEMKLGDDDEDLYDMDEEDLEEAEYAADEARRRSRKEEEFRVLCVEVGQALPN